MSWIDQIPPNVVDLALKGAEALARVIAEKLGLTDDIKVIERIKDRMLTAAFEEGVDLGLALSELSHGARNITRALELAAKVGADRMNYPADLVELEEVSPDAAATYKELHDIVKGGGVKFDDSEDGS